MTLVRLDIGTILGLSTIEAILQRVSRQLKPGLWFRKVMICNKGFRPLPNKHVFDDPTLQAMLDRTRLQKQRSIFARDMLSEVSLMQVVPFLKCSMKVHF